MLSDRQLIEQSMALIKQKGGENTTQGQWLKRVYQQGKQISQIIAYIWRWIDPKDDSTVAPEEQKRHEKCATRLREIFLHPSESKQLKILFHAVPIAPGQAPPDESESEEKKLLYECGTLLYSVFQPIEAPLIFPIFDSFEEQAIDVIVDVNRLAGDIADSTINEPGVIKWVIPFPPRPQLGPTNLTIDELKDWIADRDPQKIVATNPYIPTTTS